MNVVQVILNFFQSRLNSRYAKNFVRVASANIVAQALPVAMAPVMTRLYSPGDYGVLGLYAAVVAVICSVAVFRIDWLVSSSRSPSRAYSFIWIGFILVLGVTLCVAGLVFILNRSSPLEGFELLRPIAWVVPVGVLTSGVLALFTGWFVREANLAPIARGRIIASLCSALAGLVLGFFGAGIYGLLAMTIAASIVPVLIILMAARMEGVLAKARTIDIRRVFVTARLHQRRLFYSGSTGIINTIGLYAPILLISIFYSPTEAGWYALMHRLATVPLSTLTSAIGQSFWGEANLLYRTAPNKLGALFSRTVGILIPVAGLFSVICMCGPFFIGSLFGRQQWSGAGFILAALTPFIATQLVASPLSAIVTILGYDRWIFYWDLFRTVGVVSSIIVAATIGCAVTIAVLAFSCIMAFAYLVLFFKMRRAVFYLAR